MLDIQKLRSDAEQPGHNPWQATVGAVEDLDGRLSSLETETDSRAGQDLDGRLSSLETETESLRTKVSDLTQENQKLTREVSDLEGRIGQLEKAAR